VHELQRVFNYQEREIRTITKDGDPWFVAKDVCDALEIVDTRQAVERLDDDERCLIPVTDNLGRMQDSWTVNEPGLYALILGSRKPEAKAFKRWITHEVIPAIRKTGSYGHRTYGNNTLDALMDIYHLDRDKLTSEALTVLIKAVAATAKQPKIIFDTPIGIKLPNKPKGVSKELTDEIYNYLIDWLEKNESHFELTGGPLQEGKTKFGMIIENRAFIYPEVFRGALLKGGYVEMTALRSLAQEELIDTEVWSGKRRFKIRKYDHASKKQRRFVSLKLLL